jgi:hypothetical protein
LGRLFPLLAVLARGLTKLIPNHIKAQMTEYVPVQPPTPELEQSLGPVVFLGVRLFNGRPAIEHRTLGVQSLDPPLDVGEVREKGQKAVGDLLREILKEQRAEYGQEIVPTLSAQLASEYGRVRD